MVSACGGLEPEQYVPSAIEKYAPSAIEKYIRIPSAIEKYVLSAIGSTYQVQ